MATKPPSDTTSKEVSGTSLSEQTDLEEQTPPAQQLTDQTIRVSRSKIITIFLACASVDLVALIDQTSLAAALSIVSSSLNAGTKASWIAGGYFITSTSFQLLYGRLSDIWSRKLVLLTGLAIFFIGSLASSLSQNVIQLIIFRALTGVGGGGLMTVAQIIVSDVVSLRDRGKYQGILGAVVAIANGIGPVIGGALAGISTQSWRWIFRLNMPMTVITTICVVFFMPLKQVEGSWREKIAKVDFFGCGLTLAGSTLFILGLTWGGVDYAWDSAQVLSTIILGIAATVAFVLWQGYGTSFPLVPLHIFRSRMVNGACITMFINGWNFVVQVYYIPTFYQLAYGYSAVYSATLLLPLTLIQTLSSTLSGLIVTWRGRYRESILVGWMCWAVGLGLFSTLDASSGLGKQIGYAILTGIGVGQTLQPSLIAIQAGVEKENMAVVTGTRNFVRNLGSTVGLSVAGSIINNALTSGLSDVALNLTMEQVKAIRNDPASYLTSSAADQTLRDAVLAAYAHGFQTVFRVGASIAGLAMVVAALLMPQIDLGKR
ncbi:MFS drug transporter-2 [Coleophoma cylindrospora]|uniref:MFS drug transporter-2 n=1 Tax=Coleophoma cylindrospora TaxID=1849047 RepID=A0A3D8RN31_9HELO|nr:MFS drug transporter-2 [Coleophoma cylindrospora]